MIFKVNFNPSQVKTGKQNTYVSFCEKKLFGSRLAVHCFLYKFLIDSKIINFHSSKFSYDVRDELFGKLIKCFITNGKPKLFCKLEQLVKPQPKRKSFLYNYDSLVSNKYIMNDIAREIDDEIFREINLDLYPDNEPINFNDIQINRIQPAIDYEREFPPIEILDNVHYDMPLDEIEQEPLQYELAIGPFGDGNQ